mgnify:CR=1 FL=1
MKNFKKVLSVVLAVAMLACSMAISATTASADDNYTTIQSWGINDFNNFQTSGLTSDAEYEVLARDKSVGIAGYGIWGYVSTGTNEEVVGGTEYEYRLAIDWDGVVHNNTTEFGIDCWVKDADNSPTYTGGISTETIQNAYNEALEKGFRYTSDGNRYFEVSGYLTVPQEADGYTGEFRVYTRGFINYRIYTFELFGEDIFNPIATINSGDANAFNDMDGIRVGKDDNGDWNPYIENHNYSLPRGFRVLRGDYAESKLALGGTSKALTAGRYAAQYNLFFDGVYCGDEDVLATANVKNAEGTVIATKDIKKSDITCTIIDTKGGNTTGDFLDGTVNAVVPFTVDAEGTYSIELLTTGKANMTVTSAAFAAVIPAEEIKAVEDAITAIGDVKYDPDLSEDSGPAIEAARKAYDDLAAKYGDVSAMVSNYNVLTNAETSYNGKKTDYNDMVESAANVDEAIDAITTPITLESKDPIEQAEVARDYFISSYGEEKAKLHIKGLDKLKEYREQYDKLTAVKSGDVNGDGVINTEDALMVLQSVVGITELDENAAKAADVNSDEKIDTQDALGILQYVVGIRTELPYKD